MSRIILHQHQHNDVIVLYDTLKHEIILKSHDKAIYYYVTCSLDDIEQFVTKCKTFRGVESIIDNLLGFTT